MAHMVSKNAISNIYFELAEFHELAAIAFLYQDWTIL